MNSRPASQFLALEPRMLFDGAMLACCDPLPDDAPLPPLEQPAGDGAGGGTPGLPPTLEGTDQDPSVQAGQTLSFDATAPTGETGRAGRVTVSDPDGPQPPGDYWLTLHGYHGVLEVDTTGDATVYNSGTPHVAVAGSLDEVNRALSGLRFTLEEHYRGDTVIRITVTEPGGGGEAADLVVHVLNDNEPPVANDDARILGTARGTISGNVLTGAGDGDVADTDPDGDRLALAAVAAGDVGQIAGTGLSQVVVGQYGTLTLDCDGSYSYATGPGADALAVGQKVVDVFTYKICDPEGGTDTALLTFEIDGPDPAPSPPPVVVGPPPGPEPLPVPPPPPTAGPAPAPDPSGPDPLPPGGDGGPQPTTPTALPPPVDQRLSDPVLLATALGGLSEVSPAPVVLADNAFLPFSPTAVLGRIESERERKADELRRAAVAPIKAEDDCPPEAKPKPKVVKRSVLVDGEIVKPKTRAFTEQIEKEGKRLAPPVKKGQVRGVDC